MSKILSYIPSWETFLLYIGGIPTLFSGALLGIMFFFTSRGKAFSYKDYKFLRNNNKLMIKKEQILYKRILAAPKGVKILIRWWIGETSYHDFMTGR